MPRRDMLLYINDIYYSCSKILEYTKGYDLKKFKKDGKTVDAVVRNLEIIGEAAKNVPAVFKNLHKTIAWKEIIGMRNKVAHEYFGIDEEILWETVRRDIPMLFEKISKIKKDSKKQILF